MPVEMDHVVGAARVRRRVQHLGEPGEGGGAQHVQVQALHLLGAAADQPSGHRPERHILAPAGRQITSSTRNRSPAASGKLNAGGLQVGADERPASSASAVSVPGSRSSSHGRPGASAGSVSTSTRTPPAGPAPVPRSPPHPAR